MKKITIILCLASLIIVGSMVFLIKKGISLRMSGLISPSEVSEGDINVAHGVAYRLFPDLQSQDIILIGWPEGNSRLQALSEQIALQAEQLLGQPLHRANNKMDLQNCPKLCWVPVSASEAQELEKNNYIESVIKPLRRSYFTLNMNEFTDYDKTIIAKCEQEKRLDFSCFQALSIMNAQKRMKDPNKRYFFMNRYEDRGNYLLLQRQ